MSYRTRPNAAALSPVTDGLPLKVGPGQYGVIPKVADATPLARNEGAVKAVVTDTAEQADPNS